MGLGATWRHESGTSDLSLGPDVQWLELVKCSSGTECLTDLVQRPLARRLARFFIVLTDDVAISWRALGGLSDACLGKVKRGVGGKAQLVEPRASVCVKYLLLNVVFRGISRTWPMGIPDASHKCACLAGRGCYASPGGYKHACQEVFMLCALI